MRFAALQDERQQIEGALTESAEFFGVHAHDKVTLIGAPVFRLDHDSEVVPDDVVASLKDLRGVVVKEGTGVLDGFHAESDWALESGSKVAKCHHVWCGGDAVWSKKPAPTVSVRRTSPL